MKNSGNGIENFLLEEWNWNDICILWFAI